MKKVMFLYHIKERECAIIDLIEEEMKKNVVSIEIRRGEFYSSIMQTISFSPDIIVSIPPRDVYSSNILTVLKIITGAIVISMNTEGYSSFSDEEIRIITGHNTHAKELVDYYIMWGPETKRVLGKRLLEDHKLSAMDRIITTGYVWYEIDKTMESYKRHSMYQTMQKWFAKFDKNILVITGFFIADYSIQDYSIMGLFAEDKPLGQRTPEEIAQARDAIATEQEFREKYIDRIVSLAKRYPDTGFVVKLHPVEIADKVKCYDRLQAYSNIFLVKEPVPVGIMLQSVDCMIHYNSTCHLEAYIYKVPMIQLYDDSKITSYKFTWQLKSDSTHIVHIDDSQELNAIIEEGVKHRRLKITEKRLYGLYNWQEGVPYRPIEKTAACICSAHKPQRLKCNDQEVFKALNSKEGQNVLDDFIKDMIGKISENKLNFRNVCSIIRLCKYVICKTWIMGEKESCERKR